MPGACSDYVPSTSQAEAAIAHGKAVQALLIAHLDERRAALAAEEKADEARLNLGAVSDDLDGLDLDLLGGRWVVRGCRLYLTVPVDTTDALRDRLIEEVEEARYRPHRPRTGRSDVPNCLLRRPAVVKASA